jgi:hypothetical protein
VADGGGDVSEPPHGRGVKALARVFTRRSDKQVHLPCPCGQHEGGAAVAAGVAGDRNLSCRPTTMPNFLCLNPYLCVQAARPPIGARHGRPLLRHPSREAALLGTVRLLLLLG